MSAPALPGSLKGNPRLDRWLRVDAAGFVEVSPGKVEIGQGIITALMQIAADELDVSPSRVRLRPASTAYSPDEGVTSGSLSIQDCGAALRHVCAQARALYLARAGERMGVDAMALRVEDGDIRGPGNLVTSYWELADDALLAREATPDATCKPVAARGLIGASTPRPDLAEKILGGARFIHDVTQARAGLDQTPTLHGRVLRPPSPAARLTHFDDRRARLAEGVVTAVRDGDFVGVVARDEHAAQTAIDKLRADCRWRESATLPDEAHLDAWLRTTPVESVVISDVESSSSAVSRTVRGDFLRPFTAHASIGLVCAVAQWRDGRLHVWSHTQGVFNLRADLALVFDMTPEAVIVTHLEGAGCYGHNGADDVALDAALLARAADGAPVRVVWSRADELSWAPLSPAMAVSVEADLDADNEIVAWRHDVWSNGHATRPGRARTPTLLAAQHLAHPFPAFVAGNMPLATGGGADRNAIPGYRFARQRVTNHRLLDMPLRTSAMRALGAVANVFAIESTMDDVAHLRCEDPIAFRLRHLDDARGRAVIEAAAQRADWSTRAMRRAEGVGHGVGYARYKNLGAWCAVIAEIEALESVRVRRLTIAVDVGDVVNTDGVVNQIEGGAIQATSWALKEAVRFDDTRVLSVDWESYPILTFSEAPAVDVEIIARQGERSFGAGEASQGPTVAAIGNAVRDAFGVRVRALPITFERIAAAIEAGS